MGVQVDVQVLQRKNINMNPYEFRNIFFMDVFKLYSLKHFCGVTVYFIVLYGCFCISEYLCGSFCASESFL